MERPTSIARKQYKDQGLVRNDLLRKQIIASWERSRIYSIEEQIYSNFESQESTLQDQFHPSPYPINGELLIVESNGRVISHFGKLSGLPHFENVDERSIGTNAFSICVLDGPYEIVEYEEHYISVLSSFISECIRIDDNRYALAFSIDSIGYENLLKAAKACIDVHEIRLTDRFTSEENISKSELYFVGISREIDSVRRSMAEYSENSKVLIMNADSSGMLKAMVDYFICLKRERCDTFIIDKDCNIDVLQTKNISGSILVIKDVYRFRYKDQLILQRFIQEKSLITRQIIWGFTSYSGLDLASRMIVPGLNGYLNCPKVTLADIGNRREDIPYICKQYMKNINQSHRMTQKLINQVMESKVFETTEDLITYLDFLMDSNPSEGPLFDTIKHEQLPYSKRKTTSLQGKRDMKEIERDAIMNALEQNNFVLIRTAEQLGIGRTTLYRKMKEYMIKI